MFKKIRKFLISLCIICLLFTCIPTRSYGFDGGVLLNPLTNLFVAVGDGVVNLMQKFFIGQLDENGVYFDRETKEIYFDKAISYTDTGILSINAKLNIIYGPATIFSGNIDLFNINLLYNENDKSKANRTLTAAEFKEINGYYDTILNKSNKLDKVSDEYHATILGISEKNFKEALTEMGFNFSNYEGINSMEISDIGDHKDVLAYIMERERKTFLLYSI